MYRCTRFRRRSRRACRVCADRTNARTRMSGRSRLAARNRVAARITKAPSRLSRAEFGPREAPPKTWSRRAEKKPRIETGCRTFRSLDRDDERGRFVSVRAQNRGERDRSGRNALGVFLDAISNGYVDVRSEACNAAVAGVGIDIGSLKTVIAVSAEMVGVKRVDGNKNDGSRRARRNSGLGTSRTSGLAASSARIVVPFGHPLQPDGSVCEA